MKILIKRNNSRARSIFDYGIDRQLVSRFWLLNYIRVGCIFGSMTTFFFIGLEFFLTNNMPSSPFFVFPAVLMVLMAAFLWVLMAGIVASDD